MTAYKMLLESQDMIYLKQSLCKILELRLLLNIYSRLILLMDRLISGDSVAVAFWQLIETLDKRLDVLKSMTPIHVPSFNQ